MEKQKLLKVLKFLGLIILAIVMYISILGEDKITQQIVMLGATVLYMGYLILKAVEGQYPKFEKKYRCRFKRAVIGIDKEEVWLKQKPYFVEISVVPFPGLSINSSFPDKDNTAEDGVSEFNSYEIKKVHWNNNARFFECEVAPFEMSDKNDLGAVIYYHQDAGWILDNLEFGAQKALDKYRASRQEKEAIV